MYVALCLGFVASDHRVGGSNPAAGSICGLGQATLPCLALCTQERKSKKIVLLHGVGKTIQHPIQRERIFLSHLMPRKLKEQTYMYISSCQPI